ncbi:MAG: hypothetical protein ABSD44_01110, partial [Terracidiphilus sp.]
ACLSYGTVSSRRFSLQGVTTRFFQNQAEPPLNFQLQPGHPHLSYFSDETTVPPGMEIYFSIPIAHVNKKWHFAIPFQLVTNSGEPIREPYGYAMFYWYDLPKAYRKGL